MFPLINPVIFFYQRLNFSCILLRMSNPLARVGCEFLTSVFPLMNVAWMVATRKEQMNKHSLNNLKTWSWMGKRGSKTNRKHWVKIIKTGLHTIQILMTRYKVIFCHFGLKSLINTTSPTKPPIHLSTQSTK